MKASKIGPAATDVAGALQELGAHSPLDLSSGISTELEHCEELKALLPARSGQV